MVTRSSAHPLLFVAMHNGRGTEDDHTATYAAWACARQRLIDQGVMVLTDFVDV